MSKRCRRLRQHMEALLYPSRQLCPALKIAKKDSYKKCAHNGKRNGKGQSRIGSEESKTGSRESNSGRKSNPKDSNWKRKGKASRVQDRLRRARGLWSCRRRHLKSHQLIPMHIGHRGRWQASVSPRDVLENCGQWLKIGSKISSKVEQPLCQSRQMCLLSKKAGRTTLNSFAARLSLTMKNIRNGQLGIGIGSAHMKCAILILLSTAGEHDK
mmetsp:Transcript_18833/g.34134  ORF Transcript_18833/g.34134 Transcript_18833/m.34134 type:complete len:213 (-) Transcript_18833:39-677(-)